jgi:hypothetical protein
MLNVVILSVAFYLLLSRKSHFTECCYAERRYVECRGAKFGTIAVSFSFFLYNGKESTVNRVLDGSIKSG